jgi:hypothetical protein
MRKSGIVTAALAALALAAALGLSSCQEFFTTSLGTWAERDSYDLSGLTEAQALKLYKEAVKSGNTKLASALLSKLSSLAISASASSEVVEAAVDTAVVATGVSNAVNTIVSTLGSEILSGSIDPSDYATVASILESITVSSDAIAVFTLMTTMTTDELTAAGVSAEDCAMAAAALLVQAAADSSATLEDLVDGTATLSGTNYTLAQSLLSVANTLDSSNSLYTLFNSWA